jgi:site-specific DNA-methyltransferase (cytosine-N4-specific)
VIGQTDAAEQPFYVDEQLALYHGDALAVLRTMPAASVNAVVTSPPYYGLRDYGEPGQYGLEPTPAEYVERMREVFAEVRRVLANDGTLWLNLGDSYARGNTGQGNAGPSSKLQGGTRPSFRQDDATCVPTKRSGSLPNKNLLGIPWKTAFALQDDGWILRNDNVWHKPNAMPESVRDRFSAKHEYVFLLVKSEQYWFDLDAVREPLAYPEALDGTRVFGGKNKGSQGGVGPTARRRGANVYGATGMPEQTNMGATGARHTHGSTLGRNPGDVWSINTAPFAAAHFAVFPPDLAERCIMAGCRPGGTVLDPFCGSGTTGMVALKHGRRFVGVDLSQKYLDLALRTRLAQTALIETPGGETR